MDIDRHGPRLMPNNCKNLSPPNFSLPTTFNRYNCISGGFKDRYWDTFYSMCLASGTDQHITKVNRKACRGLKQKQAHNCCILLQHTAMTQFRNKYSQKRNCEASSQFPHSCVCERSVCLFFCRKHVDQSREYINRSQTHECGNWDWGRSIPFLGIHKWDFFAVQRAFGTPIFSDFFLWKILSAVFKVYFCITPDS